jgi:energy-coupling factor transporter ATP-binding protein EcfA2
MSKFIKKSNTFRVYSDEALDVQTILPSGTFVVKWDQMTNEFYLESVSDFELPSRFFGEVGKWTDRILETFEKRTVSTGVLLTGEKGSGKTLLTKNIASRARTEKGYPTIIVNEPHHGSKFNSFVQSISQPVVIVFDEFEKVFDSDEQQGLLTLLDGVYPTKKLFCFTCNDGYRVTSLMKNRPGRLFYAIDFHGLSTEFIAEYCEEVLIDKQHIPDIIKMTMLFGSFNFDMLKALVEEMNRYRETPQEALALLNIDPVREDNSTSFKVKVTIDGLILSANDIEELSADGTYNGLTPLRPFSLTCYDKESEEWNEFRFDSSNIVDINPEQGFFKFSGESIEVEIRRVISAPVNWRAL